MKINDSFQNLIFRYFVFNKRRSVLSMLPCGRPFVLKNRDFLYLFNFLHIAKQPNLLGFEHREYASRISFEKCGRMHWSTSQMDVWRPSYGHFSKLEPEQFPNFSFHSSGSKPN